MCRGSSRWPKGNTSRKIVKLEDLDGIILQDNWEVSTCPARPLLIVQFQVTSTLIKRWGYPADGWNYFEHMIFPKWVCLVRKWSPDLMGVYFTLREPLKWHVVQKSCLLWIDGFPLHLPLSSQVAKGAPVMGGCTRRWQQRFSRQPGLLHRDVRICFGNASCCPIALTKCWPGCSL